MTKRNGKGGSQYRCGVGGGWGGTSSTDSKNGWSSFLFLFHAGTEMLPRGAPTTNGFFGGCIQCPDWLRLDPDSAKNVNPDLAKNVNKDSAKNLI
jgi:hypothetical protein